jgi:signal transduction histidine kinase
VPRRWCLEIVGEGDLLALQAKIALHLPVPMAGVRLDGTVAFVNAALERRLFSPVEHIVGRHIHEVLVEVAVPPYPEWSWKPAVVHGRELDVSLRVRGEAAVPFGVTLAPVRMGGRTHGFILMLRDKSAALRSLREARLATAGLLATVAAHEMKNPLQAVRGFLQLALARQDINWVASALEEIDSVVETIDQLLVFAKEPVPFPRWLNVDELFRKVRLFLQYRLGEVDLVEDVQVPELWGDERLLRQILVNLTTNALEACDGRGTVWLRAVPVRGGVLLSVEDTGPGIPSELIGSIFEPFTTTKPEGSGLGLYVSAQVAKAHGGSLVARNRAGGGCVMEVFLPAGPQGPV